MLSMDMEPGIRAKESQVSNERRVFGEMKNPQEEIPEHRSLRLTAIGKDARVGVGKFT
jgi:hypothetical protein